MANIQYHSGARGVTVSRIFSKGFVFISKYLQQKTEMFPAVKQKNILWNKLILRSNISY